MSVLIVDDDADLADSLKQLLELYGLEISGIAKNGKIGAELFSNLKPDVVLLDLMMPEYNGFYCYEKIRKVDRDAKIIIMTANPDQSEMLRVEDPDVIVYEKPLPLKALVTEIKGMISPTLKTDSA